jgi:pimeloyl-ACP methyl ester carboxylesterase
VGGLARFLAGHGAGYDHLLTFDYESFNTRIGDNGQALAEALRAAGFGPGDGLHLDVFAHSMGALVARSLVELWGGDEFVDRCFLAGPPNLGTRLAEARCLVPWIGTLLINQAGPAPPTIIASWALKKISDDGVGPDDLRPGSGFLQQLNASTTEVMVPYYILAGRNEIPPEAEGAWDRFRLRMDQGTDAALDYIFGDENDLVVDIRSMLTVRGGHYPRDLLHTQLVPCNHFGYFSTSEAQGQLLRWLGVA